MKHLYALWLLVILLAAATIVALVQVQNVQAHQNDVIGAIICHAEHLIRDDKGITPDQRRQALRFYQQQIEQEHLKPCATP